ncbi:MAG: UbiA family prenyltransferase [Thermoanaerobaculum sp.]
MGVGRHPRPHPGDLLAALRPLHWLKNAFVLAPMVFSGKLCNSDAALRVAAVAVGFSLAASASYLVNDLHDKELDRATPRNRNRPIARGAIPDGLVWFIAPLLAAAGFFFASKAECLFYVLAYSAASHAYTFFLKKIPALDVACLVGLYTLRLLAGAAAAWVPPSPWLLSCGGVLALALAWGKRIEEPTIYVSSLVRRTLPIVVAASGLLYLAYSLSSAGRTALGSLAPYTSVPALVALVRYLRRARAGVGDPMTVMATDQWLAFAAALWVVLVLVGVTLQHCI